MLQKAERSCSWVEKKKMDKKKQFGVKPRSGKKKKQSRGALRKKKKKKP